MTYGIILQISQNLGNAADTLAQAATTAITPPVEQSISLWDMAVKGGGILIPIAILSVMAFYIFLKDSSQFSVFQKLI
ncbi:MAG: hypothetical protein IPG90_07605 [Bacteroidetes bacterium]|nr:hypothetical protein [Bacteroidota bacterium]